MIGVYLGLVGVLVVSGVVAVVSNMNRKKKRTRRRKKKRKREKKEKRKREKKERKKRKMKKS